MALIDFLKTTRSKEDLAVALAVLREFKACESDQEYLGVPFAAWAKLEQIEEFLAHLVEGKELERDTRQQLICNHDHECDWVDDPGNGILIDPQRCTKCDATRSKPTGRDWVSDVIAAPPIRVGEG